MYLTATELRLHAKKLFESIARGEEIIITFRGKPFAKVMPVNELNHKLEESNPFYGIWKDRSDLENVDAYVRNIRRRRLDPESSE
jgi:prevent-host-death family protein